jgi:hypothetical protein
MSDNTENVETPEETTQGKKMQVVASATFTKEMVQNAVLRDILANDEYREQLAGQELAAFYQFNPHHAEAFCLLTLARDVPEEQEETSGDDDDDTVSKAPEILSETSPFSLTDEE